jgi:hypothetical protein
MEKFVTVQLVGGIGNQLFGLAVADHVSKVKNYTFYLRHLNSPNTIHSNLKYFESIFSNWRVFMKENIIPTTIFQEESSQYNIERITGDNIELHGYFQNYKYITSEFLSKIVVPTHSLEKYPNIENTVFLHIRGGDYVLHWLHEVGLDNNYYQSAIKQFPEGTHFSVFTNDIEYAKSKSFLNNISHSFINENEVDSLFLMSQCSGGICANSTFSWWGAFLNRNRKLTFPSKVMNIPYYHEGYCFPELIILDV